MPNAVLTMLDDQFSLLCAVNPVRSVSPTSNYRAPGSGILFYVRQPVAPVTILEMLYKLDLATSGGRSLLEVFSNPMRSQETGCGKTLINPHLLKIHAKHAAVVPQIPALAAR